MTTDLAVERELLGLVRVVLVPSEDGGRTLRADHTEVRARQHACSRADEEGWGLEGVDVLHVRAGLLQARILCATLGDD